MVLHPKLSAGEVDSMETGSYLENVPPTSNEALSRVCVKEEPRDVSEGDITADSVAAYEASELLPTCRFDDSNIDEASESPVLIPTPEVRRSEDTIRKEVQAGIFAADSTVESPVKTLRKRVQHHKDWKDVKRKRLRNSGQEYFGRNGVVHEARRMKELTNHKCNRQCHLISEDERKQLFQQYWALADYNAQVSWICGAIEQVVPKRRYSQNQQEPRKGYTRIFYMTTAEKGSLTVCKTFFLTTLGISNGVIDRALKKQRNNDGMPATDKRGQHTPPNKLPVDDLEYIKQHLSSFPRYCSYYTWEHLGGRRCLPPEINLRKLYMLYQEKCREDGRQPLKEWAYRNIFQTTQFDLPTTSERYMQEELTEHARQFSCWRCPQSFLTEVELHLHMETHPQSSCNKRHKCIHCPYSSDFTGNLQTHMRIHTGERPFRCTVCGKAFAQMAHVQSHMSVHTGERPYKCTECGKGFVASSHQKRHMRIHTGERPYKCSVCGKTFTQVSNVHTHMKVHTGERPHECSVCGKTFIQPGDVRQHMMIHTGERPYGCSVCSKAFLASGQLKKHMRIHTGERPYKCTVCGKAFPQVAHVRTHMRVHTGERPYKCSVCGKGFAQVSHVHTHMVVHTKD